MSLQELIDFYMKSTQCTKLKATRWAESVLKEPKQIKEVIFQSIRFLLDKDKDKT